jgi:hypothetical protein
MWSTSCHSRTVSVSSPSSRKVLEYEPVELIGTALSSVCHPVISFPLLGTQGHIHWRLVNVVFRIRRKHSGYTWFRKPRISSYGAGKGRKCIILVGRERPCMRLHEEISSQQVASGNLSYGRRCQLGMFLRFIHGQNTPGSSARRFGWDEYPIADEAGEA